MSEISERLAACLDRLVCGLQREKRLPSISAAVLRDGELIWETAVGAANVEASLEATPDTQYRIGSITKTFTAAAIMQLRDAGKLDLDDPVARYVPELECEKGEARVALQVDPSPPFRIVGLSITPRW